MPESRAKDASSARGYEEIADEGRTPLAADDEGARSIRPSVGRSRLTGAFAQRRPLAARTTTRTSRSASRRSCAHLTRQSAKLCGRSWPSCSSSSSRAWRPPSTRRHLLTISSCRAAAGSTQCAPSWLLAPPLTRLTTSARAGHVLQHKVRFQSRLPPLPLLMLSLSRRILTAVNPGSAKMVSLYVTLGALRPVLYRSLRHAERLVRSPHSQPRHDLPSRLPHRCAQSLLFPGLM